MRTILILLVLFVISPVSLWAEAMTKEQGDAILKELKAIRQELNQIKRKGLAQRGRAKSPPPNRASVSTLNNPALGDLKAPVTLVEFTDYQCPFCRQFYSKAYKKLKKEYVDTGKLRFVLRDLPLPNHQYAKPAAISTHCAGEQGKFWEMHDALFDGGGELSEPDILLHAIVVGLEDTSFKSCLTSGRYNGAIAQDVRDSKKAGIRGTPAFVLGRSTDNVVEGMLISGTRPFVTFKKEIDRLLLEK
jgi:protein-disulfide isomerase